MPDVIHTSIAEVIAELNRIRSIVNCRISGGVDGGIFEGDELWEGIGIISAFEVATVNCDSANVEDNLNWCKPPLSCCFGEKIGRGLETASLQSKRYDRVPPPPPKKKRSEEHRQRM